MQAEAGVAQWLRSWRIRLTQSSVRFIAKCKKCVWFYVITNFPCCRQIVSSGFQLDPISLGMNTAHAACLLLEKGGSIMHIIVIYIYIGKEITWSPNYPLVMSIKNNLEIVLMNKYRKKRSIYCTENFKFNFC